MVPTGELVVVALPVSFAVSRTGAGNRPSDKLEGMTLSRGSGGGAGDKFATCGRLERARCCEERSMNSCERVFK